MTAVESATPRAALTEHSMVYERADDWVGARAGLWELWMAETRDCLALQKAEQMVGWSVGDLVDLKVVSTEVQMVDQLVVSWVDEMVGS